MTSFRMFYLLLFFFQLSEVEQRLSQLEALVGGQDTTVVREREYVCRIYSYSIDVSYSLL